MMQREIIFQEKKPSEGKRIYIKLFIILGMTQYLIDTPPVEKVAIFDEAQRAWDEQNLTDFYEKEETY